jgi:hypothetical protein
MRFFELRWAPGHSSVDGREGTSFAGMAITRFSKGQPVDRAAVQGPVALVQTDGSRRLTDFCFAMNFVPVVSARVADVLRRVAGDDAQLFEAEIEGRRQPRFLVNVAHARDCMDELRGKVERIPPTEMDTFPGADRYRNVWRLMVDPDRVGDHHLFRIDGYLRVCIIASEELVRALEAIGATGIAPFLVS